MNRRDTFLYLDPQGDPRIFAQCASCRFFMPNKERCANGDFPARAIGSCGTYAYGVPSDDQAVFRSFTAQEAGYVERDVRCVNCWWVKLKSSRCGLYLKLLKKMPKDWDLDPNIHLFGCCNAQVPKDEEE